uniref:Eotaxin-like n=1 Tax=Sinocyclocheilus rhinocerous TaxID=307959 RepID=A0A673G5Y2_9TELE
MKTFMKTSSLFLMLCCALQLNTSAGESIMSVNSICCFKEINIRLPLKRLESYFWTISSRYEIQKNLFCMDPDYKWVQWAIKYLDTYLHK